MVFYDTNSISLLQDKLDYEKWLLKYISDRSSDNYYKGSFYFRNDDIRSIRSVGIQESVSETVLLELLKNTCPLIFVSSYKILDMMFEWILEEHERNGVILRTPWSFYDKIQKIKNLNQSNLLKLPPIMQNEIFIFNYTYALYENLRDYRNEIVHNNNFAVTGEKLEIKINNRGVISQIEVNNNQMIALMGNMRLIADLILNDSNSLASSETAALKHNFDVLSHLHNLGIFNQEEPVLFTVSVNVQKNRSKFKLHLDFIRDELKKVFPDREILFELIVVGITGSDITDAWHFPEQEVPDDSIIEFDLSNYQGYKISITDLEEKISIAHVKTLIE